MLPDTCTLDCVQGRLQQQFIGRFFYLQWSCTASPVGSSSRRLCAKPPASDSALPPLTPNSSPREDMAALSAARKLAAPFARRALSGAPALLSPLAPLALLLLLLMRADEALIGTGMA